MTKYVRVDWPESQVYIDHPRFKKECMLVIVMDDAIPDMDVPSIMVPEDLYEEVTYKLQFPKKYENTELGTIVCYETRAVVNGEDTYWYDEDLIKKGSEVLIYNHEIENYPKWIVSKCIACSTGFPILFEDRNLLPGINCEIIGVKA